MRKIIRLENKETREIREIPYDLNRLRLLLRKMRFSWGEDLNDWEMTLEVR